MHLLYMYTCLTAEPDVLKEVKQKLELGAVKFEVWVSASCLSLKVQAVFE